MPLKSSKLSGITKGQGTQTFVNGIIASSILSLHLGSVGTFPNSLKRAMQNWVTKKSAYNMDQARTADAQAVGPAVPPFNSL